MTRDRAKELLPIIAAFAEGNVIQKRFRLSLEHHNPWTDYDDPEFMSEICSEFEFRIKPEPQIRPFTQAEAARFRLFRSPATSWTTPVAFNEVGIHFISFRSYVELCASDCECSTGIPNSKGEIEWQRCGVEVNSQPLHMEDTFETWFYKHLGRHGCDTSGTFEYSALKSAYEAGKNPDNHNPE